MTERSWTPSDHSAFSCLPDDAEVLPVPVDHQDLAERALVDELLELLNAGVIEEQVAGHEDEVALLGDRHELVDLRRLHRGRLLDEDVLAGLERVLRELVVRRHRRRDHDCVELRVVEHLVEGARPSALADTAPGTPRACRSPGRRARRARRGRRSFVRGSSPTRRARPGPTRMVTASRPCRSGVPFAPVAFRRSTTSTESSTSAL